MPLDLILILVLSVIGAAAIVVVLVVGVMRLAGRRSRFDRLFDAVARTQDAAIYPPILRGNQMPAEIRAEETSRAANVIRDTPTEMIERETEPDADSR